MNRAVFVALTLACAACGASSTTPNPIDSSAASSPGAAPSIATSAAPESACALLARTCHSRDKDGAVQHACHMLGHHGKDPAQCEAKRAECLTACGAVSP